MFETLHIIESLTLQDLQPWVESLWSIIWPLEAWREEASNV